MKELQFLGEKVVQTSLKFVQKLRELNKNKHMYYILNECVDYFDNFDSFNLALEHILPYRALQDNNPYSTLPDHGGTIWDHAGLYGTIQSLTEPSKYKRDHKAPNVTLTKQTWSIGPF